MSKETKFTLTKWGVGLYVLFVMFFGGMGVLWAMFGWMTSDSSNPWYHVLCFIISMFVMLSYEYWAVRLIDYIADKLDI